MGVRGCIRTVRGTGPTPGFGWSPLFCDGTLPRIGQDCRALRHGALGFVLGPFCFRFLHLLLVLFLFRSLSLPALVLSVVSRISSGPE